jgi:hypothetical protein
VYWGVEVDKHIRTHKHVGYGLDDWDSRVRFPAGAWNFSLHYRVQNGTGAHPASYPMVPGAFFLGVKRPVREADHSHPSSTEVKECVQLYLHSPNTPSRRGAQLKKARDNFTFTFFPRNMDMCNWKRPHIGHKSL